MITATERGFTVIELMLFFGISGALFAALMFGVNATVGQQRYRESVVSLSTMLQSQYSEVSNTRNTSSNDWACTTDGELQQDSSTAMFRGTSPCVLLGKAIEIKNGNEITIYRVAGCEPSRTLPQDDGEGMASSACGSSAAQSGASTGDFGVLRSYNPKRTDFDQRQDSPEWNSTLVDISESRKPLTASFLILRSPSSGLIRVFTSDKELPTNLGGMINADAAKAKLSMCVVGDSAVAAKQSITIDPSISGPDGVVVNQADRGLCG